MATTAPDISNITSIASKRRSLFGEIAAPQGLDRYDELFDVSRIVVDSWATRSDLRIIEESDDEVQQCIETRMDTLVGVDWRLEGGSAEVREWLTEQVKRHYEHIVTRSWTAKLYGYSVMERVWAKDNEGMFVVERVSEKPFEWFIPKRDETLWYRRHEGIILTKALSLEGMPVDTNFKFLLTRNNPTWRNPRGTALLAYLFWPWFFRKATWQFWMQFLERNGQPLLVGTGNDPAQIAQQLALAVQDAVIGVPKDTTIQSISPTNKGEAFNLAEDRLVRRIQKILLGQTLTSDSGSGGKGSRALGEVHNEVRLDKTVGDLKLVGPTVQNYVNALLAINFPSSRPVKLVYAIDRGLESARANRDSTLINSGNIEFTEEYYITEYGFKKEYFKVISPSAVKQSAKDQKKKNKDNAEGESNVGKDKDNSENDKREEAAARERGHTLMVVKEMGAALVTAVTAMPQPQVKVILPKTTVAAPVIEQTIELNATLPSIKQTVTKHITSRQIADGVMQAVVTEEIHNDAG